MGSVEELKGLMQSCVEMGYIRGQIAMSPASDKIRKRAAEELIKRNGFNKAVLSRWVSEGLVEEHKGERNSPIWYSLMQIMETISAVRCSKIMSNYKNTSV